MGLGAGLGGGLFGAFQADKNTEGLSEAEMKGKIFAAIDVDGDGILTREEVIAKAPLFGMSEKDANKIFDQADADKDGTITKAEFFGAGEEGAAAPAAAVATGDGLSLYRSHDGKVVGTFEEVEAYENEEVFRASDGFVGTYNQMIMHERQQGKAHSDNVEGALKSPSPGTIHVYVAEDGFQGTFAEVVAHEENLGLHGEMRGELSSTGEVIMKLFEAPDGFCGTYDEVVAHEEKLGIDGGIKDTGETMLKVYMAPDGFHGSYDEVVAHEKKMSLGGGADGHQSHIFTMVGNGGTTTTSQ